MQLATTHRIRFLTVRSRIAIVRLPLSEIQAERIGHCN